jgi:hypothetical protein
MIVNKWIAGTFLALQVVALNFAPAFTGAIKPISGCQRPS